MLTKLLVPVLVIAALAVFAPGGPVAPRTAEAYPGADNFTIVSQECVSPTNVRLNMQWTTYGFGPQWFDVSLHNNGWIWGTFVGAGPIAANQGTFVWEGFVPGQRHYLRVNTLTSTGWYESQTVTFVTRTCAGGGASNKTGPQCDGQTWCVGDPMPPQCNVNGNASPTGDHGCLWVNRFSGPRIFNPGDLVILCYWVNRPMFVRIVTESAGGQFTANVNGWDDGRGDCIRGTAGSIGPRDTVMYGNGAELARLVWVVFQP